MRMRIERIQLDPEVTIGDWFCDGEHVGYSCEDAVREQPGVPVAEWKVHGRTAIPYGSYQVEVTMSPRFKRLLPLLRDVPGFAGIRIHPGNDALDTEGCLLPGLARNPKGVGQSRLAFDDIFIRITRALAAGEEVWIDIVKADV